ncbi:MAG TPA: DUF3734 domain-containing protein [Burkholderiaceae bacterium]|nr:DUF3734 domain-containing protein [Burkholderiaceae bacterium]
MLQGGGALGAYQAGVYQAMHEADIEPDWLIGTSIGAINAAIIAGNAPARRVQQLARFWESLEWRSPFGGIPMQPGLINATALATTLARGVAGFFTPHPASWWSLLAPLGVERAAFYRTDGGVYSHTPIEAVLADYPRRSSTIFTVHLWNPSGTEPESIWQVLGRQKDIQYASRAASHIARQKELHRLRHVISELSRRIPKRLRETDEVRELAAWGCRTTMHVVRLLAPRLIDEDHTKDVDFTPQGIRARWQAGYADAADAIAQAPWARSVDPIEGVVVHEHESMSAITTV